MKFILELNKQLENLLLFRLKLLKILLKYQEDFIINLK